jgi:hypothetical protein
MKVALTFWLMFVMSFLFLGFRDDKTAYENALPIEKLTPEQDLWARKTITIYREHYHNYFLLSNDVIPLRTLIHDLCQYFIILSLIYLVYERVSLTESIAAITAMCLTFFDLIDYLVTHNDVYFYFNNFPITFNVVSITIDSLVTLYIYHLWTSRK